MNALNFLWRDQVNAQKLQKDIMPAGNHGSCQFGIVYQMSVDEFFYFIFCTCFVISLF